MEELEQARKNGEEVSITEEEEKELRRLGQALLGGLAPPPTLILFISLALIVFEKIIPNIDKAIILLRMI